MIKNKGSPKIEKWFTQIEYVDQETGEIVTRSKFERDYIKKGSQKTIEIKNNYGIIKRITYGEVNRQTRLKL